MSLSSYQSIITLPHRYTLRLASLVGNLALGLGILIEKEKKPEVVNVDFLKSLSFESLFVTYRIFIYCGY